MTTTMLATNFIQDAFSPLITLFKAILVFLHGNVTGGSWGLAIIGLTIVVRAALVPLTVKQFSSMAKLQALGPDIKALQARYKDDKQRLNEEMMKFYRENQVNPFSSCLPLVLQFPVFISLFYMLRSDLKVEICGPALKAAHVVTESAIQHASCETYAHTSGKFLFIPDVTASGHGAVLIVLIVLYIGSQLIASLLTTATVDRNQRLIALGLPFLFTIFIIGFPTGLILYWITTNLWTVGQQYIVRRYFPPPNMPEGAGKPSLSLGSLFARGDDAAKPAAKAPARAGGGGGGAGATKGKAGAKGAPAGTAAKGKAGARGAAAAGTAAKGKVPARGGAAAGTSATGKAGSRGPATTTKAKAAAVKGGPAQPAAKTTPPAAGRRKGVPPPAAEANGAGDQPKPKARAGQQAKQAKVSSEDQAAAVSPRSRGTAPPPPPRKKKKRSGRRR